MKTRTNTHAYSLQNLINNIIDTYMYNVLINSEYKKSLNTTYSYNLTQESHLKAA
ncbi:hypothetical protein [Aestuariivivens sediminicola]|uniref:hypothetical protein n=1 Tax=Aestuariivivens sediminicola TaxID=2913560 RepID=UPI001F59077D|nr:hypothetical protein [Aestuariivivens sediminicola]